MELIVALSSESQYIETVATLHPSADTSHFFEAHETPMHIMFGYPDSDRDVVIEYHDAQTEQTEERKLQVLHAWIQSEAGGPWVRDSAPEFLTQYRLMLDDYDEAEMGWTSVWLDGDRLIINRSDRFDLQLQLLGQQQPPQPLTLSLNNQHTQNVELHVDRNNGHFDECDLIEQITFQYPAPVMHDQLKVLVRYYDRGIEARMEAELAVASAWIRTRGGPYAYAASKSLYETHHQMKDKFEKQYDAMLRDNNDRPTAVWITRDAVHIQRSGGAYELELRLRSLVSGFGGPP